MLYNYQDAEKKKPTDTAIFGTNMMFTQNIKISGKNLTHYYKKFDSIEELIKFKESIKKPPKGNIPININRHENRITISGRLSKPKDEGNIAHDPNIGTLTSIAKTSRLLSWKKDIVITKHGIRQAFIDSTKSNKFLKIAAWEGIKLEGLAFEVSNDKKINY
ncbi:MAG: hypothetical protein LBV42_02675 [Methanobrevibacter sp.]|jgi:hypothetical protein|nr:hypothetical protein [Methanobrevibacter sp.]